MVTSIYNWIERKATWPMTGLLVVGMLLLVYAFNWRSSQLGPGKPVLDVQGWYTPEQAAALLEALEPAGRSLYAWTQLTIDLLFPLTYGSLFAILILQLTKPGHQVLVLIPVLAAVFDLLENFTAVYLTLTFDGSPSPLAWFAAVCTLLKFLLFLASIVIIAYWSISNLIKTRQVPQDSG